MSDSMDKHFMTLDHQDWTPVVVKKNTKDNKNSQKKKTNPQNQKIKKIEKRVEEDDLKHKKITPELKQKIIHGRCFLFV